MSYDGHQRWGRDQRRSHPYQRSNDHHTSRQDHFHRGSHEGYQDQGRNSWSHQYNDRRGYFEHEFSSSFPSFNHSSGYNDRYESYNRGNEFNGNPYPHHSRDSYHRQSMPELREDLRPPPGRLNDRSDSSNNLSSNQSTQQQTSSFGPPMDLQMRTLRVTSANGRELDKKVTKEILLELFIQVGPVRNIVLKPSFAFIEFQDVESVAYAIAAMDGIQLFGRTLNLEPKIRTEEVFRYLKNLRLYEQKPELFGH